MAGIWAAAAGGATDQSSHSSCGVNICPPARAGGIRPRMTTGHGRPDKLDRKLEGHAGETSSKDKLDRQAGETSSKDKLDRKLKGQAGHLPCMICLQDCV